jgi:hypothetical protein
LSGIVDIGISLLILFDIISVKSSPLPIFFVCFIIGNIYLGAGLAIAYVKMSKQDDE